MAIKLNDTQLTILANAGTRDDHRVLPFPPTLKAPMVAVGRTVMSLVKDGLLEEVSALTGDEAWQQGEDCGRTTLVVTKAGLAAVGIEAESETPATKPDTARTRAQVVPEATKGAKPGRRGTSGRSGGKGHRPETRQAVVVRMLRNGGASIAELARATGWQDHSVRGVLTATIKKRLGLPLVSEKGEDGARRYHIAVLRDGTGSASDWPTRRRGRPVRPAPARLGGALGAGMANPAE